MKRLIYISILSALVLAGGCSKKKTTANSSDGSFLFGEWKLVEVTAKSVELMPVYLSFSKDKFEIYQKSSDDGYTYFSGEWELYDDVLYGKYSSGGSFSHGSYTVYVEEGCLHMEPKDGSGEVDIYEPATIPSYVKESAGIE